MSKHLIPPGINNLQARLFFFLFQITSTQQMSRKRVLWYVCQIRLINISLQMLKFYISCVLLACLLTVRIQGLTAPFNSCKDIFTKVVQMTLPGSDFTAAITTPSTFTTAQPDSTYQALASFQQFVLSNPGNQLSIKAFIFSKSIASLTIGVTGADGGSFITTFRVVYLVIPSAYSSQIYAFTVDCCFTTSCIYTKNQPSNNAVTLTKQFPTPLQSGSNSAWAYFNSIYLKSTAGSYAQSIDIAIVNSNDFTLTFTNVALAAMYIGFYQVSVIVYHMPALSLGLSFAQKTGNIASPSFTCTLAARTFYGLSTFQTVTGRMDFSLTSSGNTFTVNRGGIFMVKLEYTALTFTLGQCCPPTPYVDNTHSQCVDQCPVRMFLQTGTMNCMPCASDCYTCTNISVCTGCNSTTDNRTFNAATGRCDLIPSGGGCAAYPTCCAPTAIKYTATTTCVVSCPQRTFHDTSSNDCLACASDCYTCTTSTACTGCNSTADNRTFNASTGRCDLIVSGGGGGGSCVFPGCCASLPISYTAISSCVASCPERTYHQTTSNDCMPCLSDCYTCTNSLACTSCNSTVDNRMFNATTGRCDLISAGGGGGGCAIYPTCCAPTPIAYTATTTCVASCPGRTFHQTSSNDCLPCTYDCFTCSSATSCTACDNIIDMRQLNPSTLRCDPIFDYYDNGVTVAIPCAYPNCCGSNPTVNTITSTCIPPCPSRTYLDSVTFTCPACNYDCLSCSNGLTCLSCDGANDNRQLNGATSRCDPLPNYYKTGVSVAAACGYPTCCGSTPIKFTAISSCVSSCPTGNYHQIITNDCLPCAYDCFTCNNNLSCTACDSATDHRQLNTTTFRCDPLIDYYDAGATIAPPCAFPRCCGTKPIAYRAISTCVASCPVRTFYQNITNDCLPCAYDCYTCNDNVTCVACTSIDNRQYNPTTYRCVPIVNYYESNVTHAAPCLYAHCCGTTPVIFYQNLTCLIACPKNYTLNIENYTCTLCDPGYWSVSNLCINIVGCIAAMKVNGTIICLVCDFSAHYALSNHTCICSQGYQFNTVIDACVEICGNGYHFDEQCDDGNLINEDGCTENCTVERFFTCESRSSIIPSKCLFIGNKFFLTLNWVNKTEGKNQGVFSFKVSTLYLQLNLTKLFVNYNFTSNPIPTSTKITNSYDEILLYADYDEDLQGRMAELSLELNPDYILNVRKISATFSMKSSGVKLIVVKNYATLATINQIIMVLSYVVIGIFLVASLAYKMIGVEALHSFLIFYFVCLETMNQTEPYMLFKSFKPININFLKYFNFYSNNFGYGYRMQEEFLTKVLFVAIISLPVFVILILKVVLLVKSRKTHRQSQSIKEQKQHIMVRKVRKWSYDILFMPLAIGYLHFCLFPAFLAETSISNSQFFNSNIHYILQLKLFLNFFCSFVFFYEFKTCFTGKIKCSKQMIKTGIYYESFYLLFWFAVMITLSANCLYELRGFEEYLLTLYIAFNIFWYIRKTPYERTIHNVGQIINLVMVSLFLSWSVIRKYFESFQLEEIQILIMFFILGLMSVTLSLSLIRTILQLKGKCKCSTQKVKKQDKVVKSKSKVQVSTDKIKDLLEKSNKYMLHNMLVNKKILDVNHMFGDDGYQEVKLSVLNDIKRKHLTITTFQQ